MKRLIALILLLVIISCTGEKPIPQPTIKISSPTQNSAFEYGQDIKFEFQLTNFTFNTNDTKLRSGFIKITLDKKPSALLSKTNQALRDTEPGAHRLVAELVSSKELSYNASDEVVFLVKEKLAQTPILINNLTNLNTTTNQTTIALTNDSNKPDFDIYFPTSGFKVKGNLVALRLVPKNFFFGKIGDKNQPGYGHLHIYVNDQKDPLMSDKATQTISNLKPKDNTITVELVNNNHTSYGVKKSVQFYAQSVTEKQD